MSTAVRPVKWNWITSRFPTQMKCVMTTKSCLLCYSCMNSTAPKYLQELILCYLPVRHLQSSTHSRLRIPSVDQGNNKKHFGVKAFSNAAPKLCNSQPITLREHNSKEASKKKLKTYLLLENEICSDCTPVTFHFFFSFFFFFLKAQWACCCSMDISALYKSSSS